MRLRQDVLLDYPIDLLHGQLSSVDKEEAMDRFRSGDCRLLVTTTVIEVGIDVPSATVILIEQAERFGLAQLHQLRGRVGRGTKPSHCLLLRSRSLTPQAEARLNALAATTNGFEIAEKDLALRGPGDVLGTRQSGLPTFRVGDLVRHRHVLEEAREAARQYLEQRGQTRDRLLTAVKKRWEGKLRFLEAG